MIFATSGSVKRLGLALAMALVLVGCSEQELYSGLTEAEANDMVALLYGSGIPASKNSTVDNLFAVSTEPDSFSFAVNLLRANGFPREQYDSLGQVFAREGFVSSPLEERARLNHALSQEIARTLSNIDGVIMARVHLAVPEKDTLIDSQRPASASVFIKHRSDVDLTDSISRVKALVVNGIENLPYDNVTVALFDTNVDSVLVATPALQIANNTPARTIELGRFPYQPLTTLMASLLGLCALLGGGFWWWRTRILRSRVNNSDTVKSSQ